MHIYSDFKKNKKRILSLYLWLSSDAVKSPCDRSCKFCLLISSLQPWYLYTIALEQKADAKFLSFHGLFLK